MRPEHSMLRMADRATRRSRVQFGEAIAMMRPANAPRVRHGALSVRVISHSLRLLDWMAIVLAGWVIASWPPAFEVGADMSEVVRLTVFGATLFVVVGETTGAYLLENILSPARFWAPLINAWVVTLLALAAVFLALQSMIDDGGHPFLVSVLIGSSGVITSRALAMPVILRIRRSGAFNTRVAILGTGKQAAAVTRYIMASYVQAWAMLREARDFIAMDDGRKFEVAHMDQVRKLAAMEQRDHLAFTKELIGFTLRASGFAGKGASRLGAPHYDEFYRGLVDKQVGNFARDLSSRGTSSSLRDYWKDQPAFKPPMTSLRDVDEAGYIVAAARDPLARGRTTDVDRRDLAKVMKAIRTQRGSASEMDADGGSDG